MLHGASATTADDTSCVMEYTAILFTEKAPIELRRTSQYQHQPEPHGLGAAVQNKIIR